MLCARTSRRLAAAALMAACVASTPVGVAYAEPPGGPPPPPGQTRGPGHRPPPFEDMLERHADRLGLDERVRTEIRNLASVAREEGRGLEESLRGLHDEMRRLLDQETPNLEAALQQADRLGAAETALHKLRLRTMLQIRALLTPEQRQELVRIHEERRRDRDRGAPPDGPPPDGEDGSPPFRGPGGPPPGPPPGD